MRGGFAMDKIKVLWMNNGDESLLDYIGDTSCFNIMLTTCHNVADCERILKDKHKEWNAIMLNADFKRKTKKDGIKRSINRYDDIIPKINEACLPLYVVTDNEKLASLTKYIHREYAKTIYLLNEKQLLFGKIVEDVNNTPEFKIRQKYNVVCNYCENPHLINLLVKLEKGSMDFPKDTSIPNECRTILEWIRNNSPFKGKVIPYRIMKIIDKEIEDASDFYCDTYDQLTLNDFSRAIDKTISVPEFVKRSFHRCCSVSNEGSHLSPIDVLIGKNEAPYVNISLIYDLLNVLYWCSSQNHE